MIPTIEEKKEKFLSIVRQTILQFTSKCLEELEEQHQREENDYFKFKCLINAVRNSTDNVKEIKDIRDVMQKMGEYQKGVSEATISLQMSELYKTLDEMEKLEKERK